MDRYERLTIEKFGITAFGMEDIERYGMCVTIKENMYVHYIIRRIILLSWLLGIYDVIHMALNKIDPHSSKSLHVSFDIDSLDPLEAPSTGTPGRDRGWVLRL